METSFELLSSMSPRINKKQKPIKKAPTILALKKYFRKSLALDNSKTCAKNESIISIGSSSLSSDQENKKNETPIVISDSETEMPPRKNIGLKKNESPRADRLVQEKFRKVEQWIDDVNKANKNISLFSEVSTVFGDDNSCSKQPKSKAAMSSTLIESRETRFDQLFRRNKLKSLEDTDSQTSQSSSVSDRDVIDDSFDKQYLQSILTDDSFKISKTPKTKTQNKVLDQEDLVEDQIDLPNAEEYEELLDSLYGDSWRDKKDEILPSSEPTARKTKFLKTPMTEKPQKKIDFNKYSEGPNLRKGLQKARLRKALDSPWAESLKKLCDSDTESENNENVLSPIKLNFEDENDDIIKPKLKQNTNKKNYSFLESLSGSTPLDKCDMTALIFRKNFHQHRDALLTKLFELYNVKVFEGLIPKDTAFEWNDRMRGTAGTCVCKKVFRRTGTIERTVKICLAKKVLDSADRLRDTLIHELCHAATWIVNGVSDGHGSFWKSWAYRAMKTFPELPPIKRCHNYVINTKYTYRCTGCGYSIGRHSKSLDTDRKRCGHCYGTFEVLINKTSKKGETKSVPVTPKKPNEFAIFVKGNYANYKTPDMKHGDVMKLLSQKFSDMKVNKA